MPDPGRDYAEQKRTEQKPSRIIGKPPERNREAYDAQSPEQKTSDQSCERIRPWPA